MEGIPFSTPQLLEVTAQAPEISPQLRIKRRGLIHYDIQKTDLMVSCGQNNHFSGKHMWISYIYPVTRASPHFSAENTI
jgi:hypothetical protein